MRPARFALTLGALAAALTACAGGGGPPKPNKRQMAQINRALSTAPGAAQPSTIVAVELAFARTAREEGQWTAFQQFAAPGALLHGVDGPFPAEAWLATQSNPAEAMQWEPRAVAISCDGQVAVAQARYVDPDGMVGNVITVWERQSDGAYRYAYVASGPDVPQPPPRKPVEDGDIVVTAIDAVQGLVASCPRGGAIPPPPALSVPADGTGDARLSRDGSLRYRWEHRPDGTRFSAADYYYEGRWLTAFEQSLAPAGGN